MILPINSQYQIISTSNSWNVQKHNGKQFISQTFHTSLESATKTLADEMIRAINSSDLQVIVRKIDEVLATIAAAMPGWAKAA